MAVSSMFNLNFYLCCTFHLYSFSFFFLSLKERDDLGSRKVHLLKEQGTFFLHSKLFLLFQGRSKGIK